MSAMNSAAGTPRDLVLRGGTVITMDDARHRADALWLHGERIGAVGGEAAVRAAAPASAQVVDLDGAVVLPGFVDAHCHIAAMTYLLATTDCTPEAAPTISAILDRLANGARSSPAADGWVTGHSLDRKSVV